MTGVQTCALPISSGCSFQFLDESAYRTKLTDYKGTQALLINLPNQGLAVGEFLVAELAFSYRYVHTQYGGSHTRYNASPHLDEFDDENALMAAFDTQTDIYNTIPNSLQPHTSDQEWRSYNYHFGEIEGFFTEGARPKNASFLRPLPNDTNLILEVQHQDFGTGNMQDGKARYGQPQRTALQIQAGHNLRPEGVPLSFLKATLPGSEVFQSATLTLHTGANSQEIPSSKDRKSVV